MSDLMIPPNMGGQLQPPIRDTLLDVLGDPTINKVFGGSDEKLSTAQAGLAAAVTVKMQERLIGLLRESHQRELGLIAGFWKLYRTPLFQPVQSPPSSTSEAAGTPPPKKPLAELFSWGNVFGGAAILLVALGFYYTKLTSDYQERWKNADAELTTLRPKYAEEEKANEVLQIELAKATTRADSAETTLKALTANSATQQQQLLDAITDLSNERGEVAKQVAANAGEKKFQALYEREAKELGACQDQLAKAKDQLKGKT